MAGIAGLGAVALGLLYANHTFGPTEAEVVKWGRIAIALGAVTAAIAVVTAWLPLAAIRLALAAGSTAISLMQLPPVAAWFLFHGSGISDGSPPSAFVAHWAYSLPHLAVAVLGLAATVQLVRHALTTTRTPNTPGDHR